VPKQHLISLDIEKGGVEDRKDNEPKKTNAKREPMKVNKPKTQRIENGKKIKHRKGGVEAYSRGENAADKTQTNAFNTQL